MCVRVHACVLACVCVWFILFSAGSVNSVTCSRDFWGQLYPSANFYLTCTPLPELIMKMICANHLIYPAYNTFAMQIGGTANAGGIGGLASCQRNGNPVGRCSGTERCTGFNLGNYTNIIPSSSPRSVVMLL